MVDQVRKRDGRLETFNQQKITNAISRAFAEVGGKKERGAPRHLSDQVAAGLEVRHAGTIPSVEEIQDEVEDTLIKNGYSDVAKAYILYRNRHAMTREYKSFIGVVDDLKLGVNAIKVLQRRYLRRDSKGDVVETPSQMFRRVARAMASVDQEHGEGPGAPPIEERFYRMMVNLEFLPNSPTLMNAGTPLGQLSACFVIPIEDSLESIFDAVKATAIIHRTGGGTGFAFSRLRPQGDVVKTTGGVASGPISFMKIFDATTEEIRQGGRRRGANMGVLSVHHPDVVDFVTAKSRSDILHNFNLSVAVDDRFMKAAETGVGDVDMVNPRNGKKVKTVSAMGLFSLIVTKSWETGDPGLLFIDEINRGNPTPKLGRIEATNPCGEVPLLPYESCNLGSINLAKVAVGGRIDWKRLAKLVQDAVRFLDDVIEANRYQLKQIERITKGNRKIGLGVMGFAEALIMLGVRYDSEQGVATARKLMRFIQRTSHEASEALAEKRGSFPNFAGSVWEKKGYGRMRNATTTTIAPTGTISIIAGCSSGIEPLFAISFVRDVMEGTRLLEVNPLFEETARKGGFYSTQLMMKIAQSGSVQEAKEVPPDVRNLFVTALDIAPEWHVRIQAAFQEFTDNAVSKTVNIPHEASPEKVRESFLLAWKLKCKGITVYRYGSKPQQVLYIGALEKGREESHVVADSEYAGGCAGTVCPS